MGTSPDQPEGPDSAALAEQRAKYEKAFDDLEFVKNAGSRVTGRVVEQVEGGLIVDVGLRGYLPAALAESGDKELGSFVGLDLECKVIEVDRGRNNVVLSSK